MDRPKELKVRIVSDGNPLTTKIYDVETGAELKTVTSIDWHADASGHLPEAKLTLMMIPLVIEGTAEVLYVCSHCKKEMENER
jgi:hypothetical protein